VNALVASALLAGSASGFNALAPTHKENPMPTSTAATLDVAIRTTHIRLLVTDYDKEYRFFRDVLGFKPTFGAEGENYADFDCNGSCIALFKRKLMSEDTKTEAKPAEADTQDRVALIFGVADVDAMTAKLKRLNVPMVTEPHDRKDWGIRVAHFRDPDGNLIEVNHGLAP
jgi:catechol 2,3-dioxygenase-like lactoylglutathione lyase family enzyme